MAALNINRKVSLDFYFKTKSKTNDVTDFDAACDFLRKSGFRFPNIVAAESFPISAISKFYQWIWAKDSSRKKFNNQDITLF